MTQTTRYFLTARGDYGGDLLEKQATDLFAADAFPSYELFWQKFVVPRTNRPGNRQFTAGVPLAERELAASAYALLYHLTGVYAWLQTELTDASQEQVAFEQACLHLAMACDMHDAWLQGVVQLAVPAASNVPGLPAATDRFDQTAYGAITTDIQTYRVGMAQAWHLLRMDGAVLRMGVVDSFAAWAALADASRSKDAAVREASRASFAPMRELVQHQADALLAAIDALWVAALPLIPKHKNVTYVAKAPVVETAYDPATAETIIIPTFPADQP